MPLMYIPRYFIAETVKEGGTQYIENNAQLTFGDPTTIYLYDSVFSESGQYVLFDYSDGQFNYAPYASGQEMLDARVTLNTDDLILSGLYTLTDDPSNSRILVTLLSRATNGKQFVEGDLDFAGSTTLILYEELYNSPGTYELFEVTGTISNLSNLSCVATKSGLTAGTPFIAGNIIKVTLA